MQNFTHQPAEGGQERRRRRVKALATNPPEPRSGAVPEQVAGTRTRRRQLWGAATALTKLHAALISRLEPRQAV